MLSNNVLSLGDPHRHIAIRFDTEKLPDGDKRLRICLFISSFDRIHERVGQTDK